MSESEVINQSQEDTVQNTMSYMDVFWCLSWPSNPLLECLNIAFSLPVVVAVIYFIQSKHWIEPSDLITLAVAGGSIPPLTTWVYYIRNRAAFTQQTIAISPAAVICKTKQADGGLIEWANVVLVARKSPALVIQVSRAPALLYWIHMRNFATVEQAHEFFSKTCRYWEDSRLRGKQPGRPSESLPAKYSVQATLTYRDLLTSNFFVYGKINVALSALLLLLALRNATFLQLTEGTLGFELASCFVMFALWPIRTWRFYNNHPDWMSSTITINSEYITSTGTGTDSSYSWNSVTKVAKHCGIIMLHLSTGWAICIPIRCFPSQALADQFYLAAGQFHKQARYSDK